MNEETIRLGQTIRKLRGKKRLIDIAKETHISVATLSRLENGQNIGSGALLIICKYFKLNVNKALKEAKYNERLEHRRARAKPPVPFGHYL